MDFRFTRLRRGLSHVKAQNPGRPPRFVGDVLETMSLSKRSATATKERRRDRPNDERKTRWEQATLKGKKRRRRVECYIFQQGAVPKAAVTSGGIETKVLTCTWEGKPRKCPSIYQSPLYVRSVGSSVSTRTSTTGTWSSSSQTESSLGRSPSRWAITTRCNRA